MRVKKQTGSEWIDPDDAPILTEELRKNAEVFIGNEFQPRGRGRPRLSQPKEAVNLRLDHEVLTKLRGTGPGWQTRVNEILRAALSLDPRLDE